MFYGITEAQLEECRRALAAIRAVYTRSFAGDMMIALNRNMGFMDDPRFVAAFVEAQPNARESELLWRLHILCWCTRNALRLDGDFVECGVFRGFMTAVAAQYLDFGVQPKRWHIYDTFEGIPQSQLDPGRDNPSAFLDPQLHDFVVRRFAAFPNIEVHRGQVPEVLAGTAPGRIAFLHLDMNSSKAEVGALDVLYERLVPGAYLLLDDYGWYIFRDQKISEDAFFGKHGVSVLELPTGQGLVIKPGAR